MCEKSIQVKEAVIRGNEKCARDTYLLTLDGNVLGEISPGQFVCLQPLSSSSAMARPFSFFRFNEFHQLQILYKVVGENTSLMSQLKTGQEIKIWGPLGKDIGRPHYDKDYDQVWFVGGGMGIAPLNFMAADFKHGGSLFNGKVFYGFKTNKDIPNVHLEFGLGPRESYYVTEDDSGRYQGLVTDLFVQKILENPGKKILVITCGPKPMMRKVAEICQKQRLDCYVIIETIMACGIGVCLGCSIKMQSGEMKCVCRKGPVFNAKEVDWDALG